MSDTPEPAQHVKPYVQQTRSTKALHFSINETQSRMQIEDPHALDLEYTRLMMGFLLFNAEPPDIAMIGLGGGSLAKFCHRHLKHSRIRVVEINPHVIALRDEFHVPPDDERFTVVRGDGARFVGQRASDCDVLLVDGFDSDGLPSRLCSRRFYDDCFRMLRPEGAMVVNLHYGHARFEIFLNRIRSSFDGSVFVVDGADLGNSIVFAFKGRNVETGRLGAVRRPRSLDPGAARQLGAAFSQVMAALRELRRREKAMPVAARPPA